MSSRMPEKIHLIEENEQVTASHGAKRMRSDDNSEAPWKNVITALSICVDPRDRNEALSKGLAILNHSDQLIHDEEIASGADAAMCRLLSFLLMKEKLEEEERRAALDSGFISSTNRKTPAAAARARGSLADEIARACQISEMVYRCSRDGLEKSLKKIGPHFLDVLACVLQRELRPGGSSNDRQPPSTTAQMVTLRSATKTLRYFARCRATISSMARHPSLLSLMLTLISHPLDVAVPFEAQHNTLWALANFACCKENMQLMASHEDLMDTIIRVAGAFPDPDEGRLILHHRALWLRHSALRCLLNLSGDPQNKLVMSGREDLAVTIARAVQTATLPQWSGDDASVSPPNSSVLLQTRLFALGTLRNVAHAPSPQQHRMCASRGGILLDLLRDVIQDELDPAIRDKAAAAMFDLVKIDTASLLIAHSRLLDALVVAASSAPENIGEGAGQESASTMSLRSLHALDRAVSSRGPEESRIAMRRAIDEVRTARRSHNAEILPK